MEKFNKLFTVLKVDENCFISKKNSKKFKDTIFFKTKEEAEEYAKIKLDVPYRLIEVTFNEI